MLPGWYRRDFASDFLIYYIYLTRNNLDSNGGVKESLHWDVGGVAHGAITHHSHCRH